MVDPLYETKLDPYFDLLINGKVGVDGTDIVADSIKSVRVIFEDGILRDIFLIIHVRGKAINNYKLTLKDLQHNIPFKFGQAGDRFEFEDDKNNKKLFNLSIN